MPLYLKDKLVSGTGAPGKSAYEAAKAGGYTGTEAEFNHTLTNMSGHISSTDNPHNVTAAQIGALPDTTSIPTALSDLSDDAAHRVVTDEEKTAWNAKADAPFKPAGKSYLTFSSPNSFTLAVGDSTKHWDGTLEYFASDKTWTTWDGTTTISSVNNDGEHVLYLRGIGNTVINGNATRPIQKWTLTGSDIKCTGNIEYLLDYATVQSGVHPSMADYCYKSLFYGCTALTQAPSLPATTLADYCYHSMFSGCTALTQAPALPATALAIRCYRSMFNGCTSLIQAPALPATTLDSYCYEHMFKGCTSLKLSSTQTGEYTQEYRIPSSGTGTTASNALATMFSSTGGTFTGTPTINTTYYLSIDNMIVRETEVATLNGYVGSMIDAAIGNAIGGSY